MYISFKISYMFRLIYIHHQANYKNKKKNTGTFSFLFLVLWFVDDGYLFAETRSRFCIINKLLCLD